jgi:hypothetical protein
MRSPCLFLSLLASVLMSAAAPARAAAPAAEPGESWEVTTSMAMAGMAMPPQTRTVCKPARDDKPPVGDNDGRCEMQDYKRSGNTVSWKMKCAGGRNGGGGTGTGELTYQGRDAYSGTMSFASEGQVMTMKLAGKRVGTCDVGAQRRQVEGQVAAIQQQSAEAVAQACAGAVSNLQPSLLGAESSLHCDAKYRTNFCQRLQSQEGYARLADLRQAAAAGGAKGDDPLTEGARLCGVDSAAVHQRLCKQAEEQESLDFLGHTCVGDGRFGQAIIARECVGRDFTSPPAPKYRSFCAAAGNKGAVKRGAGAAPAASAAAPAASSEDPAAKAAKDAVNKGKDLLKGLFR